MKNRTSSDMLQDIQNRRAELIYAAEESIKSWGQAIEKAHEEMRNAEDNPLALDQYAAAKGKAEHAARKKAEAESLLADLKNNRHAMAMPEETEAYEKQLKRETAEKLMTNCLKQIQLEEEVSKLQSQAREIEKQARAARREWIMKYAGKTQTEATDFVKEIAFGVYASADILGGERSVNLFSVTEEYMNPAKEKLEGMAKNLRDKLIRLG